MLGGDALSPSPAVLRGQQKTLFGLTADVETGQELSSVAAGKSPLYQNRQSLAQITQQNTN